MTAEMLTPYTCKIKFEVKSNERQTFLLLSDVHWDNPHCNRDLLKRHLDEAMTRNAGILIFGDLFCAMQGKYDPRGSKAGIRPEHNVANYLDKIVDDAIDYFKFYAQNIMYVSPGNHECYRKDTEVLTKRGWVNITEVTLEDEVAVFDKTTIWFEKPNAVVSKQVEGLYTIESTFTKQIVSPKHAVVLSDGSKVNAEDLPALRDRDLPFGMVCKQEDEHDADWVELLTAVVMDATLVDNRKYNPNSTKRRVQFKMSNLKKIEYIKKLLDRCQVPYTVKEGTMSGINKLQPYMVRIYGNAARDIFEKLDNIKQLPNSFAWLSGDSFEAMLRAIQNTDGSVCSRNAFEWRSISKHNVDIVQAACTLNGKGVTYNLKDNASGFKNGKPQYIVRISDQVSKSRTVKKTYQEGSTEVYCLSMPQGNFVSRIEGKVAFSGNTSILKRQETDIIKRFTQGIGCLTGAYTGWVLFNVTRNSRTRIVNMSYHHGYGGGGPVTKDVIQASRKAVYLPDADVVVSGHVHDRNLFPIMRVHLNNITGKQDLREQLHLKLGTYKDEYTEGNGWAIEKGHPPKSLGGVWLHIDHERDTNDGKDIERIKVKAELA